MKRLNSSLGIKLTILTLGILSLISITAFISSEIVLNNLFNQEIIDDVKELNTNFFSDQAAEMQTLSIASNTLLGDQEIKKLLLKQDREALYQYVLPTFENIRNKFNVSILEFYLSDKTNFLRMQTKTAYGDKGAHELFFKEIESTKEATATGLGFEHTELALREIRTIYDQGRLIGYIEIGESASHLIAELKQRTNNDFAIFMDKSMISENSLSLLENNPNFKDFIETSQHIELANTGNNNLLKSCFYDEISAVVQTKGPSPIRKMQENEKNYVCSALNIKGIDGKHIALMLSISDTTAFVDMINKNRLIIIGSSVVLFVCFFLIINSIIRRVITDPLSELTRVSEEIAQGNLNKILDIRSNDEIGRLAMAFNDMVDKLRKSYEDLEGQVKQRTAELVGKVQQIEKQNTEAEDTKKAILNILDDLNNEKAILEETNVKDEAFLKSIGEGLIVTDQEGKVVLASQAALKLLGCSLNQILGKVWAKDFPLVENENGKPIIYEKTPVYGALHNKGTPTTKFFYKLDKKRFPVLVTAASVVIDGKNQGAVVVFRDITKEEEIDKMKSEFISLASHQLRTPLSAIKWFIELLNDTKGLTREQLEFTDNISRANERMIELVNSLLNISRIESGRIIINPQPINLGVVVRDVVLSMQEAIGKKKLQVKIEVDPDLPEINVDQKMIRVVYENLLTNSMKYTPENGQISVLIKKQNNEIVSEIKDTGLGIPKKDYSRVFDKFYRGENAVKVVPEGTGLGLYLTKSIIDSSKGKIWFESTEGKGSIFWFSLPLAGVPAKEGEVALS